MNRLLIVVCLFMFGGSYSQTGTITDARDGKVYKTVVIGTQTWMAENLIVSTFRNGDTIPEAKTDEEWTKAYHKRTPAWCYFNNDSTNLKTQGKLYNYHAIIDSRGFAPIGWHIPDDKEWQDLINYLGGENYATHKMKSTNGWAPQGYSEEYRKKLMQLGIEIRNKDGNGNNSSGFNAVPCGWRDVYGNFFFLQNVTWWSKSDIINTNLAYYWSFKSDNRIDKFNYAKGRGFSIRCIKD